MKKIFLITLIICSLSLKAQYDEYDNAIIFNVFNIESVEERIQLASALATSDIFICHQTSIPGEICIQPNVYNKDIDLYTEFEKLKNRLKREFDEAMSLPKDDFRDVVHSWATNLSIDYYNFLISDLIDDKANHCMDAEPFCTSDIYVFPATGSGVSWSGPNYGCLGSSPTTKQSFWYYMRIGVSGNITMKIEAGFDIDFALWGPFDDASTPCPTTANQAGLLTANCTSCPNNTSNPNFYPSGNLHDCSYSVNGIEYAHIVNGQVGQYFIMLITNFAGGSGNITFKKESGNGETDCSILEPFLTSTTPCYGGSLVLEANVIEGATYNWTSPDNQTHTGRTWTRNNATLNMAGTYTCHVTAGSSSGNENVVAVVLPNVTADFTNSEGTVGQQIQFTGTETTSPSGHNDEITVREWNFGDGATSTSVNPTHAYSSAGDYQVSYYVAVTGGHDGECGDIKTKTVQIRNEFNATVSSDGTSFCEDDATPNLTATATGGYGNYTYTWTASPACPIDYPNSATTTAHPALGNTTFTCVISDGHSTLTKTVTVTVNAIPDATITGPNPPHVNYGATTTLSVPQMSGATYTWSSDPANLIQSGQGTYQITTKSLTVPTTFYVTVSKNGCSDENSMTIAVGDALYGNIVVVGQSVLCSGESTSLRINPSGGTEQYSYNWQPANMIEGSNTTQAITTKELTSSLSYTCTITDTDNHTYNATSPTIVVNPIPDAMAYIEEGGEHYQTYNILAGNYVILSMNDIAGASYSWEPANMISNFIEPNHRVAQTINLEENSNLVFNATVTTSNGCSNEDNVTVIVHKSLNDSYITSSATETCDGFAVTLTAHPDGGTGNYSYHWVSESGAYYSTPYSQTTTVYPTLDNHSFKCVITDTGIDDKTNNRIEKSIDIAIREKPSVNETLIGQSNVIPGIAYMPYIYEYNIHVSSLHGYGIEDAQYTWELFSYYDTPNHVQGTESTSIWYVFPDDTDKNKAFVAVNEYGNALLRCTITTECGSTKTEKFIYTDGYNQGESIDEINYEKLVSVYPNPSDGELYIGLSELIQQTALNISIYSYNGMLIDTFEGNGNDITHYSMDAMPNGLYIVKITGDDFVVTKKFVLEK